MRLLATAALCTALVAPPRLRQKPRRCVALASTKASAAHRAWNATRAAPLLLPGCVLAACGRPGPAVAALGLGAAATAALSQDLRQTARDRFRANPWGYAVATPLTAAFVGWFTNWVGVQMLFYPLQWRGVPSPFPFLRRRPCSALGDLPPFGPLLGWQGIVPAKAPRMARDLVEVTTDLVSVPGTLRNLDPSKVADFLPPARVGAVAGAAAGRPGRALGRWLVGGAPDATRVALDAEARALAVGVAQDVRSHAADGLDLTALCVGELTGSNVKGLVDLFQEVGKRELRLLVNSGLVVGLALGLLQSGCSLVLPRRLGGAGRNVTAEPERRWVPLVGSGVVGCVTNWIALLWIFNPVDPRRVGPVTLQGCFLRRQPEVARDFARFFATRVLTAKKLLHAALFSPGGAAAFQPHLRRRVQTFIRGTERISGVPSLASANTALLDSVTNNVALELPSALPDGLYAYADSALGLETALGDAMAAMPSRDFERLLHPIFEEDEFTLIAVGGVLGVLAAWGQMAGAGAWCVRGWRALSERARSVAAAARKRLSGGGAASA